MPELVGRVIRGGDANEQLIGTNYLRKREELEEATGRMFSANYKPPLCLLRELRFKVTSPGSVYLRGKSERIRKLLLNCGDPL